MAKDALVFSLEKTSGMKGLVLQVTQISQVAQ